MRSVDGGRILLNDPKQPVIDVRLVRADVERCVFLAERMANLAHVAKQLTSEAHATLRRALDQDVAVPSTKCTWPREFSP